MEKIIDGHLVGFGTLREWDDYEDHIWFGGAMSEERYYAWADTPSKKECDRIFEELSGEVITYNKKNND
ncbi:hypothetical protein GCM10011409_19300 [Lentibacillus populi]|uniref:Uncharacterized protein n=1 Tax=Lentibacillus populi TaxID=1827502 RepID=A0A9W5TXD0_9BACI|nr:hypothetical protein [Lentibacillus populi]GGB41896.1 hypothetical protein GCM10011409_19300 [Lentibacillus populi]